MSAALDLSLDEILAAKPKPERKPRAGRGGAARGGSGAPSTRGAGVGKSRPPRSRGVSVRVATVGARLL
jgi:hypothetical protein